ncbi:histidine phosphatase family protein [Radiobacillus deserti]|uniref:Histidine phosphatase family protein n=1 Tax=Radiobacillus deserti TaxID=2594883 RepID=A0A516KDN2_9BACI|nr:histidine phosphatase family protein [Radiobacillus deserti]QDP39522.1 histidine phosphatase family protein [Radiobacillus deserti]
MEFVFVRHGQGEHTLDIPNSLHISDPSLTEEGINQAKALREQLPLSPTDVLICSPVRRTLETMEIWSKGIDCKKIVSPLVSPRMFPQIPEGKTLPCDKMLSEETIKADFPDFHLDEEAESEWWIKGINKMSEEEFNLRGKAFIKRCKLMGTRRIFIVSHDGTITSYRKFITGNEFTRGDFPKETGIVKVNF